MHGNYTVSGVPANNYNVSSGPMVPCDTPAGPNMNNNYLQHTVRYSASTAIMSNCNAPTEQAVSCNNYNTSAGPTSQPMVSSSAAATPSTLSNASITECTVTHDNLCNAAPPAKSNPPPSGNAPHTQITSLQKSNGSDSLSVGQITF